jgi:hypothetical protein
MRRGVVRVNGSGGFLMQRGHRIEERECGGVVRAVNALRTPAALERGEQHRHGRSAR